MSALDIALGYIGRDWAPTPVSFKSTCPSWVANPADYPGRRSALFQRVSQNIGILMGEASNGLSDVDLDCAEAVAVAPYFLPKSDAIFGRAGNPSSHWLFQADLAETRDVAVLEYHALLPAKTKKPPLSSFASAPPEKVPRPFFQAARTSLAKKFVGRTTASRRKLMATTCTSASPV